MVWTDWYISFGWHIAICAAVFIVGLYGVCQRDRDEIQSGLIYIVIATIYFLFAPYTHNEQVRNCRTKNGNTVSVTVKFKEPIIKFLFVTPRDVKVIEIDRVDKEFKLERSSKYGVYEKSEFGIDSQLNQSNKLKLSVFEGSFTDRNGNINTLYLVL